MKKKFAMIGNAHLDPTWMWNWQEGSAEAKATIRSALDRMNEFPDYVFVCSSMSVYEWIEEFDPQMFREIRERVAEGRFVIVGGWYVQPDCNLPSGEGFARQSLYAQRYFLEKFGKTALCGYNVDSFGHNAMLPQILRLSGMKYYVFMRPDQREKQMQDRVFRWFSPDGSSVLAYRLLDCYCHNFQNEEDLRTIVDRHTQEHHENSGMIFFGVGNHGGGPTIRNLMLIRDYQKNPERGADLIFSDPASFLAEYEANHPDIPEVHDELQHHASGCYAAFSPIKTAVRCGENKLVEAESADFLAHALLGKKTATKELRDAWLRINFLHFHDIMGGCCMPSAYPQVLPQAGEALSVGMRVLNNSLQSISWAIGTANAPGQPFVFFNTHAWDVDAYVRLNDTCVPILDEDGNEVPTQLVRADSESLGHGRHDTLLRVRVPAFGWRTYYACPESTAAKTFSVQSGVCADGDVLANEYYELRFDRDDGRLISLLDKTTGRQLLTGRGMESVVIDETAHDTWSHGHNVFDNMVGRFGNARIDVTENGPLAATFRVVTTYGNSKLAQYYTLYAGGKEIEMFCRLDWHEKHKMLKLAIPTAAVPAHTKVRYALPFGSISRPANSEEEPGQKWVALEDGNGALSVLNDCKYSFSATENTLYLTAIRSPIAGDHGGDRSDESVYTDQGLSSFTYRIRFDSTPDWAEISRRAEELNTPLSYVPENRHPGRADAPLPTCGSYLRIVNLPEEERESSVLVSAVKRAEDGNGDIIRLYEASGKNAAIRVDFPCLGSSFETAMTPFEIKTFKRTDGTEDWKEVLLTEWNK